MELTVEVAYVLAGRAAVVKLGVRKGATLRDAIGQSGLLREFPEIDLTRHKVGVFGRVRGLDEPVAAGDRIEIYRPLAADPKERRRRLAKVSS